MTTTFTQGHALVIGVGADLPNTVDDAQGLADILKDPGRCAYPADQVQVLVRDGAARAPILDGLRRLAERATVDSTVVVYFSGHGYVAEASIGQAYYLMPFGYDLNRLAPTAISGAEFNAALQAIQAQKILVLLDCCHAGGLDDAKAPGLTFTKAPLPPEAASFLARGQGRALIASSRDTELSYAGKPYSAFTLALIEALCGQGAARSDGYVRVADLAVYTGGKVAQRTKERQHPLLNFQQADNFVVAYYAAGDVQAKAVPFKEAEVDVEDEPGAFARLGAGNVLNVNQSGQQVNAPQTNVFGHNSGTITNTSTTQHSTVREGGVHLRGSNLSIGGDVVGRDKITTHHGDSISVGNITDSSGVAIGRGARATVTTTSPTGADLAAVFAALNQQIAARPEEEDVDKQELRDTVARLEQELAEAQKANPKKLDRWVTLLQSLAPELVKGLPTLLATVTGTGGELFKQVVNQVLHRGG